MGAKVEVKRSGHIRNPLSIIAIFAGIAEISGTIVLPLLKESVQTTYVWFLMLFPSGLVVLFFGTLWCKPTVLYAPSDYENEDNFIRSVLPATSAEIAKKQKQEIDDAELLAAAVSSQSSSQTSPTNQASQTSRQNRNDAIKQSIIRNEKAALNKLIESNKDIRPNVTIVPKKGEKITVDAAILKDDGSLTAYEIRYLRFPTRTIVKIVTNRFINILEDKGVKFNDKFYLNMVFSYNNDLSKQTMEDIKQFTLSQLSDKHRNCIDIIFIKIPKEPSKN